MCGSYNSGVAPRISQADVQRAKALEDRRKREREAEAVLDRLFEDNGEREQQFA